MERQKQSVYHQIFGALIQLQRDNSATTYSKVYQSFLQKYQKMTKLKITFDNQIIFQIISYVKNIRNKFRVGSQFSKRLQFLKKFSHQLLTQKFINQKKHKQLTDKLLVFQSNLDFKIHNALKYLNNAEHKEQLRGDFFAEFFEDKDIDLTDQETVKIHYEEFFAKCLSLNIADQLLVYLEGVMSKYQNLQEMLSPSLNAKLKEKLGNRIGTEQFQVKMNRELRIIAENQSFSLKGSGNKEIELNEQFSNIVSILNKFSGLKLFKQNGNQLKFYVDKFGSLVSGFAGTDADLDITILTNCYVEEMAFLQYLYDFLIIQAKQLEKKGFQKHYRINLISTARVPLIELSITKRQRRDTRGQSRSQDKTIKIDILLNNLLGVINSKFLKVYSQVSWIRHLGILIKKWAKAKKIIGKKMLSSYSIIILMLHFLIETNKVKLILDARGRNSSYAHFKYKRIKENNVQQFPIYYKFKTERQDVTSIQRANLMSIMKQFFFYFSQQGPHWKKNQNDQIITVDGTKSKPFEDGFIFTVKDPFDEPHNPGRATIQQKSFLVQKFNQAYSNLNSNNENLVKSIFCNNF